MPEGDTIHRTAAALRASVLGKPVSSFYAPRMAGVRPARGAVIERVESHGKHLEIGFDDGVTLHTHMRMTGSWHLYREGEKWRKPAGQARVVIEVPGWQAVCFNAPVVETFTVRELVAHPVLGGLGPDLTREDADLDECVRRVGRYCEAELPVAEMLLDQRIASGVGNVYKSEVLWACELHPFTPVGALDDAQRRRLLETASTLLRANLRRVSRVTVPGAPEGVAVYGRFGKPCLRCGTPIEVRKHGEQARVTYWCPGCQVFLPLPEPEPDEGAGEPVEPRAKRRWFGRGSRGGRDQGAPAQPEAVRPADPEDEPAATDDDAERFWDELDGGASPGDRSAAERRDRHDASDIDPYDDRWLLDAPTLDPHPAARELLGSRRPRLQPSYVDPLLAHHAAPRR